MNEYDYSRLSTVKEKSRNLKFLVDFINLMHEDASLSYVASKMNISKQGLKNCLERDDIKISYIQNIVNYFGYNVIFQFKDPETEQIISSTHPDGINTHSFKNNNIETIIELKKKHKPKIFQFIRDALRIKGKPDIELANALGIHQSTMSIKLSQSDGYLSFLHDVAAAMNWKLVIIITPRTEQPDNN